MNGEVSPRGNLSLWGFKLFICSLLVGRDKGGMGDNCFVIRRFSDLVSKIGMKMSRIEISILFALK